MCISETVKMVLIYCLFAVVLVGFNALLYSCNYIIALVVALAVLCGAVCCFAYYWTVFGGDA